MWTSQTSLDSPVMFSLRGLMLFFLIPLFCLSHLLATKLEPTFCIYELCTLMYSSDLATKTSIVSIKLLYLFASEFKKSERTWFENISESTNETQILMRCTSKAELYVIIEYWALSVLKFCISLWFIQPAESALLSAINYTCRYFCHH